MFIFNLAKLQCKQTVVTDFCIGFVDRIHIIGKGMIKETWITKIEEFLPSNVSQCQATDSHKH